MLLNSGQKKCRSEVIGEHLAAGWYWLDIKYTVSDSEGSLPALYPDYGGGCWEQLRIPLHALQRAREGRVRGVVMFRYAVRKLRLSPSADSSDYKVDHLSLVPIGRLRALLSMLKWRQGQSIGWKLCLTLFVAAKLAIRLGLRGMADHLYGEHVGLMTNFDVKGYDAWRRLYDSLPVYAMHAGQGGSRPLLSVLVPVYNASSKWLRACLDSVVNQTYENWELCVADDASDRRETLNILKEYERKDARIRVVHREENGHISQATNSALALARGEFVVLLDHDDELHPDALMEVAGATIAHPEWDLIYTDEDKLDRSGRRRTPYFKPDYNPDLLEGQNCISHLGVFRTDVVRALGGFRQGYEGSQDWDLALRVCDYVGAARVGHIPRVLYHWRISDESTAEDVSAKPYVRDAALRALSDHVGRVHSNARVEEIPWLPGHYRIHHSIPEGGVRVSFVVDALSHPQLILRCIDSIMNSVGDLFRIEFLLMGCRDSAAVLNDLVSSSNRTHLVKVVRNDADLGFSALSNYAVEQASGDVIVFINSKVQPVGSSWLSEFVSHALRPEVGVVGGKIFDRSGWIRQAGCVLDLNGFVSAAYQGEPSGSAGQMNRLLLTQNLSVVSTSCISLRRELFQSVGGFDSTLSQSVCDIDLCLRLREYGYLVVWTPFAEFYASELGMYRDGVPEALLSELRQRWARWFEADPSYNPNLSLDTAYYELAYPPKRPLPRPNGA